VAADDVLSLIGYEQDKTLFQQAGVSLREPGGRPDFDETTMETNVTGIYVAGTAVGGTQSSQYKVFLENCHQHIDRILAHLQTTQPDLREPESVVSADREAASLAAQIEAQPESRPQVWRSVICCDS
jgi:thioredoxin reductase (NADPH)